MVMSEDIVAALKENVIQGRRTKDDEGIEEDMTGTPGVLELTQEALDGGIPTEVIITQGLTAGMQVVGEKFSTKEYFIPDMLASAEAVGAAMDVLKPYLEASNVETKGKFAIVTVKGDIHDIGKNIVSILLKGAGYEVEDLGTDVPTEKIIEFVREDHPDYLGLSALLTTTMPQMKATIEALEEAGLRGSVRIMVGGAPLTDAFAKQIGADAYAPDAVTAVDAARSLMGLDK